MLTSRIVGLRMRSSVPSELKKRKNNSSSLSLALGSSKSKAKSGVRKKQESVLDVAQSGSSLTVKRSPSRGRSSGLRTRLTGTLFILRNLS